MASWTLTFHLKGIDMHSIDKKQALTIIYEVLNNKYPDEFPQDSGGFRKAVLSRIDGEVIYNMSVQKLNNIVNNLPKKTN